MPERDYIGEALYAGDLALAGGGLFVVLAFLESLDENYAGDYYVEGAVRWLAAEVASRV